MTSALLDEAPARALAVYAHPDDPEVSCGGTLAHWARAGADVRLVVVNAGDKGSPDAATDPAELTERRAREVDAAAGVLGLAGVERMGLPDGEVTNDLALRARLVELIRTHRPDIVVCPDPTAVFFGDSYVNHRDHREVGWAVVDAVAPAAASPLYFPETGPPHQVAGLLLSGTFEPDVWVDISDSLELKVAAVQCHESRVGGDPALVAELLRTRTGESGAQVGVSHAESFRRLRFG
ncbi:MAG TPA: PIG-L deacetylase family protein [Acidimicrobiales bacterium]|jgi:LmbE family N-acetylglucosaminyl deacetylase|nr:PIG-L deacetylase family protein [Acidimicrobiales bacterium]